MDMVEMFPLYEDACFTFRFDERRLIPWFHLQGIEVEAGKPIVPHEFNGKKEVVQVREPVPGAFWPSWGMMDAICPRRERKPS